MTHPTPAMKGSGANQPSRMNRRALIHHLRQQALLEGTRCSETRGQDEESIAISSCHAGKAQAYNSVANRLEAGYHEEDPEALNHADDYREERV